VGDHPELYLFSSGTLALGGVEAPVPFFLIRHPDGNVVVDGGNPLAVVHDVRAHWGRLAEMFDVHMTAEEHCLVQLRRLGVEPQSVRHIVQTHLHMDHTGALGHFPEATVVVHARELEAARAEPKPIGAGYIHADYDRPELRWEPGEGERDLFGDGTIRLFETPGHSAGHTSILVTLPETGPVLLTADAVDNAAQWEGRLRPRGLFSKGQAARSRERLRELARATGALLVLGHDPENWARLRHAPASYA
jgi:glyoxylase-like metal-dependent hydrolase (beta-lactamase superfamily II)